MSQRVRNNAAAPGALVTASLVNPNTGVTAGEVLEVLSTNANSQGAWDLDLKTQTEAQGAYGVGGTYWQIVEPVTGSSVPKTWNVLVTVPDAHPNESETLVSSLTVATAVPTTTPSGAQSGQSLAVGASSLPSYGFVSANGIGWRRGLNNALNKVRAARLACIGDSIVRGYGQGNDAVGWPADLSYCLSGRGFNAERGLVIPEFSRGAQTADPRIVYGSGWSAINSAGAGGWGNQDLCWQGTVGAANMTFTPTDAYGAGLACDRFVIYYLGFTSGTGTFNASIDGQAALNINTVQAARGIYQATVVATNGVQNNHVLTLNTVATGAVFIIGIEPRNSVTPGVAIANMGVNGATTGTWSASNANAQGPLDAIKAYAPDLAIIMLGTNDAANGTAAATAVANLQTIAAAVTGAGGSVILAMPPPVTSSNAAYALQPSYETAYINAAQANGWMMVDNYSRWGGSSGYATLNPLGWYFDGVHPDQVGYWDLATTFATALDNF